MGNVAPPAQERRVWTWCCGRQAEREALRGLLARAATGYSGVLMLRGEAGVGKTALLDETLAAAAAAGMQTARLTGVEAETQLGYAGLHRFLLPFAGQLERLPGPQRDALRSTFGLVAGPPADRFLVALAVLTLLADVASAAPLACMIDDVQWLDLESAVVLGFVARRLYAEQVVLLFAVREPASDLSALAGLPELAIGGLDDRAALELLSALSPGRLSPAVGARIVAGTGGNPLALAEVARELSSAQLAGSEMLPEPLPAGGSLEQVFGRRVGRLPPQARLLLALAAAEPGSSQALLWRAAGELGIDPDVAASADLGGLAEFGSQVVFRHPLVRSVVYYAIRPRQRRLIHRALAAVGQGGEPDRVAWHLGMAAAGRDEAVAARLEQAAGRARDRGGYAAAVTFLARAVELSAEEEPLARRLLAAAEAALIAGQPQRTGALLEAATPRLKDPLARAQARRLDGTLQLALGQPGKASSILLEAARALAPADVRGAREALLEAVTTALFVGWSASRAVLSEIARAARAVPAAGGPETSAADLLLDGFAARATEGYPASVPLFRRAIATLRADDLSPQEGLRRLGLGCVAASDLFDDQAQRALAIRLVQLARDQGALTTLPVALINQRAFGEVAAGRFDAARACFAEGFEISAATGNPGIVGTAYVSEVYELAWRGRETTRAGSRPRSPARRPAPAAADRASPPRIAWPYSSSAWVTTRRRCSARSAFSKTMPLLRRCCPARAGRGRGALRADRAGRRRAGAARRTGGRGRYPASARAACPVPGAARRRRQRRAPLRGGHRAPGAVPGETPAGPRPPGVRGMAAPPAPPPRRPRPAPRRARHVHLDGRRSLRRTGPHRAAGHRGTRSQADGGDRNKVDPAGGADRPAGQPG